MSKYAHLTQKWVEKYKKGMSLRKIGEADGVPKGTVKRYIAPYITQRPRSSTKKFIPEWKKLYEEGYSVSEIAQKSQVHVTTVARKLQKEGILSKKPSKCPPKYEKFKDEWIELYQEKGESLRKIAAKYGCSTQTVSNVITQKIDTRSYSESSRKYAINETYFSSIDTKEKAYWLGYLFASGSILPSSKSYTIQVVCTKKDENQIKKFLQAISSESPVSTSRGISSFVRISNETMYKDLEKWGLIDKKWYLLRMPMLDSTEYTRSFILGYFDGKASLPRHRPIIVVSGPKAFLEDINLFIENELGFPLTIVGKYQKEYGYDRYKMASYSKYKTLTLLRWLYHNQPILLKRHKNMYYYYEEAFPYDDAIMKQLAYLQRKG